MHGWFPLPSIQHLSMQVTPAQHSLIHFNGIREIFEGLQAQVNTRMDRVEEKGCSGARGRYPFSGNLC